MGIEFINPFEKNEIGHIVSFVFKEDVMMGTNRRSIEERELKYLESKYRKESDYLATTDENVGICEVNGNNPARNQEDAVAVDIPSTTSDAFMSLELQDKKRVMETTFAALQDNLDSSAATSCGSCACVATGQVKDNKATVFTSYVGDSVAFLVVLSADGKLKSSTPCNPALHDGNNVVERVTITKGIGREKGVIEANRLCAGLNDGMLAVTRAFGDHAFFNYGLLHTPETTDITVDINPDDKVYMVATCDGAMEHCKGIDSAAAYAEELGLLFERHHTLSPERLAEKIVNYALKKGSMDNITATVVPLEAGKPAVTVGVFDGHGGSYVSQNVSAHFSKVFQYVVLHMHDLKKKQKIVLDNIKTLLKNSAEHDGSMQCKESKDISGGAKIGLGLFVGAILGAIAGSAISPGVGTIVGVAIGGFCGGMGAGAAVYVKQRKSKLQHNIKETRKELADADNMKNTSDSVVPAKKTSGTSTALYMEGGYAVPAVASIVNTDDAQMMRKDALNNQIQADTSYDIKNTDILSPFKYN